MIVFDMFMTLIEDLVFSIFNYKILKIEKKYHYLFTHTLMCFVFTMIINNVLNLPSLLSYVLIISSFGLSTLFKKRLDIYSLIIPTLFFGVLTLALITTYIFYSNIKGVPISLSVTSQNDIIMVSLISRVLIILFTTICQYFESKTALKPQFNAKSLIPLLVSLLLLFSLGAELATAIFYKTVEHSTILNITILFILFVFTIFFVYESFKASLNKELELSEEIHRHKLSKEMAKKIKDQSYKVSKDKHEFYYILTKMNQMLENKEYDLLNSFILKKREDYKKYDYVKITENPLFDYEIWKVINELNTKGYDIKVVINISASNVILEDYEIVSFIADYITQIALLAKKDQPVNLKIVEQKNYIHFELAAIILDSSKIPCLKKTFIEKSIVELIPPMHSIRMLLKSTD